MPLKLIVPDLQPTQTDDEIDSKVLNSPYFRSLYQRKGSLQLSYHKHLRDLVPIGVGP